MNGPLYFRLFSYKDGYGNCVFENINGVISNNTLFASIIYKILANNDLYKTEECLKDRGFISYDINMIPDNKKYLLYT